MSIPFDGWIYSWHCRPDDCDLITITKRHHPPPPPSRGDLICLRRLFLARAGAGAAAGASFNARQQFVYYSTWPQAVKTHTVVVSREIERHVYINTWETEHEGNYSFGGVNATQPSPTHRPTTSPLTCYKYHKVTYSTVGWHRMSLPAAIHSVLLSNSILDYILLMMVQNSNGLIIPHKLSSIAQSIRRQ